MTIRRKNYMEWWYIEIIHQRTTRFDISMIEFTTIHFWFNAMPSIWLNTLMVPPGAVLAAARARVTLLNSVLSWIPHPYSVPHRANGWGSVKICLDISVMPPCVEFGVLEWGSGFLWGRIGFMFDNPTETYRNSNIII